MDWTDRAIKSQGQGIIIYAWLIDRTLYEDFLTGVADKFTDLTDQRRVWNQEAALRISRMYYKIFLNRLEGDGLAFRLVSVNYC
jgi:hypothetical protein